MTARHPLRRWWAVTLSDLGDVLLSLVVTALGLGIGIALVDGVKASNPGSVLLVATVVGVGDLLLRPSLRVLARVGGAMGALLAGLGAQVLVTWLALWAVPGVQVRNGWSAVAVLLVTAVAMALGRWIWGAGDSDYVVGDVLRRARSRARRAGEGGTVTGDGVDTGRPAGLLVVQLDGVAAPVLDQAVDAGLVPTMAHWVADGSHRPDRWWARIPSTTPASQAGILHGAADRICSFRWWDRRAGRLVVTNHPDDAAMVEQRLSDGRGLLAGGGAAVATMFSGDAERQFLVMSQARRGIGPGAPYLRFFASPFVLARAVSLTLGEVVKELYQGRRQRVRDVRPRVPRRGWYVLLRGITNVLLRDLATSLTAEQLVRGVPVLYLSLVDYDEIAHHAGPTRPESLRSLEGLDRVLGTLDRVREVAPRDYRVVVLSDHGQTLGPTFRQVTGHTLPEVVHRLMADPMLDTVQASGDEEWGPLNAFLASVRPHGEDRSVVLGPQGKERSGERHADRSRPAGLRTDAPPPDVAVTGSGNLGMVWFPRAARRLTLEEIDLRWPGLVGGLAATPGMGVVLVDTAAHGLAAVGPEGISWLERADDGGQAQTQADGTADRTAHRSGPLVEGVDPLAPFGPHAAADLLRLGRLAEVGDLVLLSELSPEGWVYAFEGQVGSHGGIGGAQNSAVLLHPTELGIDPDLLDPDAGTLVGADAVHRQLVRWAARLGLREGIEGETA
ncbi:phage holin family protein [Cellulomonas sp. NPDC089187]|uniref:phage holin family protein n=1 Tax=Cellulomonas sp. NPDC089187 TaxID=3154970 RepID=UPI003418049C